MNLILNILWAVLAYLAAKILVYRLFFNGEIRATLERDPAATGPLSVILTYPGLHALFYYRIAHTLYGWHLFFFARSLSQFARWLTGIEIHPGARIGKGLFIDHGMGVVIGETAVIGNDVTLFQGVTLGGTGKEKGRRYPTLGNHVVVGAGAKVLGNIRIGNDSIIGANAVVVRDVPEHSTVVGVPGRIAKIKDKSFPGLNLDHTHLPDPLTERLERLQHEIDGIEQHLKEHRKSQTPTS